MKKLAVLALVGLAAAVSARTALGDDKLAFKLDDKGNFVFDTGVVKGALVKDAAKAPGIKPISLVDPPVQIDNANGLLIPYRFLTPEKRFGVGAWEWPRTGKLLDDGSAQLTWLACQDRPFEVSVAYRFSAPDTLDATITFKAGCDLPKFELFVGSYFKAFGQARVYVKDAGEGKPGFLDAPKDKGAWHCFPKGDEVLPHIKDGRWKHPPYPLDWTFRPAFAAPLGMRRQPKSGACVLLMAPPRDCFALFMPEQAMGLGSLYFTLFGKDVQKGQTLVSRPRLVFGKNITDEQAVAKYQEYLKTLE